MLTKLLAKLLSAALRAELLEQQVRAAQPGDTLPVIRGALPQLRLWGRKIELDIVPRVVESGDRPANRQ